MNLGHHAADWKVFCQLAGIESVQVGSLPVPSGQSLPPDLADEAGGKLSDPG